MYCQTTTTTQRKEFHRWYALHNLHNFGAIALGTLSLYFNNDAIFNERIPILWSLGYFLVDIFDCTLRRDAIYFLHALLCFGLGCTNYSLPPCRRLRMNSQATFLECSNPWMHWSKQTRKPTIFAIFAIVYTLCRIVWIPVLMYQLMHDHHHQYHHHHPYDHRPPSIDHDDDYYYYYYYYYPMIQITLGIFYALNWYWYAKILKILWKGTQSEEAKKET